MAKKSIEGQLDMFELFDSVEELEERIKGVSEPAEEETVVECVPETGKPVGAPEMQASATAEKRRIPRGSPVMQKTFVIEDAAATVAYLDYNMVYVAGWEDEPQLWQFEQSKGAVNFYMEQMERISEKEGVRMRQEQEPIREARVIKRAANMDMSQAHDKMDRGGMI